MLALTDVLEGDVEMLELISLDREKNRMYGEGGLGQCNTCWQFTKHMFHLLTLLVLSSICYNLHTST